MRISALVQNGTMQSSKIKSLSRSLLTKKAT